MRGTSVLDDGHDPGEAGRGAPAGRTCKKGRPAIDMRRVHDWTLRFLPIADKLADFRRTT
jgi:hypothetical protein